MNGRGIVQTQRTLDGECELCGLVAECRPYGSNGENVCFDCGMKNEGAAQARFAARFDEDEEN